MSAGDILNQAESFQRAGNKSQVIKTRTESTPGYITGSRVKQYVVASLVYSNAVLAWP